MTIIEIACDADHYTIHKDHQGEFLDRSMTVESALNMTKEYRRLDYMNEVDRLLRF